MTTSLRRVGWTATVAWIFAATAAGCGDTTPTGPSYGIDDVRAALTPDVAALLDENGEFPLFQGDPTGEPLITQEHAKALAVAYWRQYGRTLSDYSDAYRHVRKNGVELDLVACGRAYYVDSADEQPVDTVFPEQYRRHLGAKWIVPLCHDGEQQMAIAVSARAIDSGVGPTGLLTGPHAARMTAIAAPDGRTLPVSPEEAAVLVARALGTRVSGIPELRPRLGQWSDVAVGGMWHFELETAVEVEGIESGHVREVARIGVGPVSRLWNLHDVVTDWGARALLDVHPWYVNLVRRDEVSFHDFATDASNSGTVVRRTDVAPFYERVVLKPR